MHAPLANKIEDNLLFLVMSWNDFYRYEWLPKRRNGRIKWIEEWEMKVKWEKN